MVFQAGEVGKRRCFVRLSVEISFKRHVTIVGRSPNWGVLVGDAGDQFVGAICASRVGQAHLPSCSSSSASVYSNHVAC